MGTKIPLSPYFPADSTRCKNLDFCTPATAAKGGKQAGVQQGLPGKRGVLPE